MENILSILSIILSGVISAIIYTKASSRMKKKELEVKLKLEEKNKWVENINKAHKDYIDSTTKFMSALIGYSLSEAGRQEILNNLIASNKTHNSLIFFMYQSEYNLSLVEEAEKIMDKNTDSFKIQRVTVLDYRLKRIDTNELHEKMGKAEEDLGINNYKFSEKLGIIIREEKKKMTTEIIERK